MSRPLRSSNDRPARLTVWAQAIGSLTLVLAGTSFAAGEPAPAAPDAPAPAPTSKADPVACNAATDRANALDMKAAQAQAQKTESSQVAALVDESISHWQQAVEHCEGRSKDRSKRNLAESQRMRASLAVVQGAGQQCESTHKDAGALVDLARQALSERRWQDASVLFHKSEDMWELASERCSGGMKDTALKRRDQTGIDAHNAEACAPRFDKAREVTQKFRTGSAALQPVERQKQSQIAETYWRELIPECKGSAQDIARNQADTLFRERGTPWVATRPAEGAVAGAAAPAVAVGASPAGKPSAVAAVSAAPNVAAVPTVAAAALAPGMVDMVVANQTRLKGRFTLDNDGTSYTGNGRIEWPNGDVYDGDVRMGLREGQGEFTWSNGQVYKGDWLKDQPQGKGRLRFANGNVYEGQVEGGIPVGQGTMNYPSGDTYKGAFADGQPHGEGTYTWTAGQVCTAQWTRGEAHGIGQLQFANGNRYQGPLRKGVPHGDGEMRYASGDVYSGHFEAGQIEGRGRYQWKNGDRFEGQWRNGLKEGPGVMTWATGDRREGMYQGDQLVGGETTAAARAP